MMTESVEITKKHLGESSDAYKTSVKNLEMIQEKLQEHKIKSNHEILQETLKEMTTASCAQEYNLETAMASARKVLENSPKVVETGFVKGLDLCRAYFNEVCYPLLEREFANFLPRMASSEKAPSVMVLMMRFQEIMTLDHLFRYIFLKKICLFTERG